MLLPLKPVSFLRDLHERARKGERKAMRPGISQESCAQGAGLVEARAAAAYTTQCVCAVQYIRMRKSMPREPNKGGIRQANNTAGRSDVK